MADERLLNALNDCVDRLHDGQSIDDCLGDYSDMAADLRPMLEVVRLAQRALSGSQEIAGAQARGRQRLLAAMDAIPASERRFRRRRSPLRWLANVAAVLLFLLLGVSVALVASQDSLPGDALYSVKRFSEAVQLSARGYDEALQAEFDDRRVDEVRQLMELGRVEEVEFGGAWEVIDDATWIVSGLAVQVDANTVIAPDARQYSRVIVRAMTTSDGVLVALEIVPDTQDGTLLPEPTQTPLPTMTNTPTSTPAPTDTSTSEPTFTDAPTSTDTLTPTPTFTNTPTPTDTPTGTLTAAPAQSLPTCVSQLPDGWIVYVVESGDTLSSIAADSRVTPELLMQVNCLADANTVVVGQRLYVPAVTIEDGEGEVEHEEPDDDGEDHEDDEEGFDD